MPKKRPGSGPPKVSIDHDVEVDGELVTVQIVVPNWAMHKKTGGAPSDKFEDEGGESMWDLYLHEQSEKKVEELTKKKRAAEAAEHKAENDARIASLKKSFEVFDSDGSGCLGTDEVLEILTRMTGGATPLTEADAQAFIDEFDRDGDGNLGINEFIVAMGVVSDAHDADGDGIADMKDGVGQYDGKEDEFAQALAEGKTLAVAGLEGGKINEAVDQARKLQS
jgi:hypothetical protein